MKFSTLIVLALCLFIVSILAQNDLPLGQQMIDSCLLPDIQDLIPCYQDTDCAALMQNYQSCVGSGKAKLSPQNLNNIQTCINASLDTDNAAFSQVLTDEQNCVNVLTQLEDSPEALQEFHQCKKQSQADAKLDHKMGSCVLGCFFMMDPNDSNGQNVGKACVLQCYLNSYTFAQFEKCVDQVSTQYEDQIKLSLKKHKKKLMKKQFQEQSETLGQQLVDECLVPMMTRTAACVSSSDCDVLYQQFNTCFQQQDSSNFQGQQSCIDQYSTTQNQLFKKVLKTQKKCVILQNQVANNPAALAEIQQCSTQFTNSIPQDLQLQLCDIQCFNSEYPAACIIQCVQNSTEFKTLESCLEDIDELDAQKIDFNSFLKTKKILSFQEDTADMTNTTNSVVANQTFGQQLVDNCLIPAVQTEMQCMGDPDCPYLAKALGECVKKAGKHDFLGQAGCLSQFSSTLNQNFKAMLDLASVCLPYEQQLYENPQAYDESKSCKKKFQKSVKRDLSIFDCAASCQSQQFTAGSCSVQCVLNSTSFQDFESCIENIDLSSAQSEQKFGDQYITTCLIPTMTDMILCLQDSDCPALEQTLFQTCDQNQPKMIDYNFTEAQNCIGNFSSNQSNLIFSKVVLDMENCLNLFSQLQDNKKGLKKFKNCNHTFESSLKGDDELGQCYINCVEQNGLANSSESDCLISCVNQTSEFTDFQDCLNQISLNSDYNSFKLSDIKRINTNSFILSNTTDTNTSKTNTTKTDGLNAYKIVFNLGLLILSAAFLLFC